MRRTVTKLRHFHEDSVISFFDQDAVVDSSAQIAIYAAGDIDNIGDAEHDVDEVKVSSEGKEPELEDGVSQRDVRRSTSVAAHHQHLHTHLETTTVS